MRGTILALVSACTLAACSQAAFPNLNSGQYRAEATVNTDQGALPVVMMRDGDKVRIEFNNPQGQIAVVNGGAGGESFVLLTADGRTVALPAGDQAVEDPAKDWSADAASHARRTGACSVAGENGAEWTQTGDDNVARVACVTNDGILLRSQEGERTVWETARVERGAQDAALFTMPAGVQTLDPAAMMQGLGEAMRQGAAGGEGDLNVQICRALRDNNAPAAALERAGC